MSPSRFERHSTASLSLGSGWEADIVVPPARLFSANGVRAAQDGTCWVAEAWGAAISAWDPVTGVITDVAAQGSRLSGPDDFAVADDGTIYVAEYLEGKVVALEPDGGVNILVPYSPKANGITCGADGRVFVDEFRAGGRLFEVYPQSQRDPRIIATLDFPNALERGPDGRLYVQNVAEGKVLSIDPDSGHTIEVLSDLGAPSAVKFDAGGRLVVSDFATGLVEAYDLKTTARTTLAALGPGVDNFCFDARGRLFVSNAMNCEVVQVQNGAPVATTGSGFVGPQSICLANEDTIVVADDLWIALVAPSHSPKSIWDPSKEQWTHRIIDVAWARERLYALTSGGKCLEFDRGMLSYRVIYTPPNGITCTSIAGSDSDVLIGMSDGTILTYGAAEEITPFGPSGLPSVTSLSRCDSVVAACCRDTGEIVLLENGLSRRLSSTVLPEAIALSTSHAYVVNGDQELVRYACADGRADLVASKLPTRYPTPLPRRGRRASVAVCADGAVLVSCDGDGSIRRLKQCRLP